MSVFVESAGSSAPLFEKFIIGRDYRVTKVDAFGKKILLDAVQSAECLDSDFFSGSIAITRDTKHYGWIHKAIYPLQRLHAHLFGRSHNADPNMCHGMIILQHGKKKEGLSHHPFLIAHSAGGGIRTANRDYIHDQEATEIIVYRPLDEDVRDLCKNYAEKTAFVEKKEQRTYFSPKENASFSLWDSFVSFFRNKKHALCGRRGPIDPKTVQRAAYLVADFLLQNQIKDTHNRPKGLFCSAYATIILQGTLHLHGLKNIKTDELARFVQENAGPTLSRDRLAKKIYDCFAMDIPEDPVAHALWVAYRKNKLARYDSQYAMPIYITKALDKLSIADAP